MANGYTYQEDAYLRGKVYATEIYAQSGSFTGDIYSRGDNNLYTRIGPGVFEVGRYFGGEDIKICDIGSDSQGLGYMRFYDTTGNFIGQIDASLFANVQNVADSWGINRFYLIGEGTSRPVYPSFDEVKNMEGTQCYQYNEGWTITNNVRQYHDSGNSSHSPKNGAWFKSQSVANNNVMPAGWYVECTVKTRTFTAIDGSKWRQYYMDVYKAVTTTTDSKTYTELTKQTGEILGPSEPTGVKPSEN